jgi:N-acetylneuraminate lyase
MAEKFIKIRKLFIEGKIGEAQNIQTEANEIIEVLVKVGVLPGGKEILNMMGLEYGEYRRPFKKLNDVPIDLNFKISIEMKIEI